MMLTKVIRSAYMRFIGTKRIAIAIGIMIAGYIWQQLKKPERLFELVLKLKERGLLPDWILRALIYKMCGIWKRKLECGGDQ